MANINIHKDLCSLCGEQITLRRRSVFVPVLMIGLGALLFVIDSFINMTHSTDSIKMSIMLLATVLVVWGLVWGVARTRGDGSYYHVGDGAFLSRMTLKFNKDKKSELLNLVNSKDFATLQALSEDEVSALVLEIYSSPKSGFCAAQLFEYAEMDFRPVSDVVIK